MSVGIRKAADLTLVARLLRDRELGAVSAALRRLQAVDARLASLRVQAAETTAALASVTDLSDVRQLHAYSGLLGRQEERLAEDRATLAALAEDDLARARHAFARWQALERLEGELRSERRRLREARARA